MSTLSKDKLYRLILKAQGGDKKALEEILVANQGLVRSIANKQYNIHKKRIGSVMDIDDLISEGNIGLITAVEKFDVSKGYHFISYAVWWIRQSILKAVCEKSRGIRLPLNRANELVQIEHARKVVGNKKSEQQEYEEIASMLNMTSEHVRDMINISRDMVSLDAEVNNGDNSHTSFGDFQEDTLYGRPDENAIDEAMSNDIEYVLNTLRPNEAKVIRMRYGLNGHKPMSLKEVGEECELTKERIRQIEKHALVRLQHPTRARRLEAYVA